MPLPASSKFASPNIANRLVRALPSFNHAGGTNSTHNSATQTRQNSNAGGILRTPGVEARGECPCVARFEVGDRSADHEPGDDEEHVDAGEAARHPARVEVVGEHRRDRDRAQAVDEGK